MLSTVKLFAKLAKRNGYGFISESVALNWHMFTPLAYKKLLPSLQWRHKRSFSIDLVIIIGYLASTVVIALSNSSVGLSPRNKNLSFYY